MTKTELRNEMRARKRAMTTEEIASKSAILLERFLETEYYRSAETIYGYIGYNQEVRTLPILERALQDGKRIALAKCYGPEMRFIYADDLSKLTKSSYGIPEPMADTPVADDRAALVLMPGLAFDLRGHRIGYGRGYYDKFLSREPDHPTVALCFDFQIVEQLPTEAYDIPADLVLWA